MQFKKTFLFSVIMLTFFELIAQSSIDGFIVSNEYDTIRSTFWVSKKKKVDKKNNFNFVQVLVGDSLTTYTSSDIAGFKKGSLVFRSFQKPAGSSFFAKQISTGKVDLFFSIHFGGKYYFKKESESNFYEIDYRSESIVLSKEDYKDPTLNYNNIINPQIPVIRSNEKAFTEFFLQYFHDNHSIVNKLKHEFYNFRTIEYMFNEFNKD